MKNISGIIIVANNATKSYQIAGWHDKFPVYLDINYENKRLKVSIRVDNPVMGLKLKMGLCPDMRESEYIDLNKNIDRWNNHTTLTATVALGLSRELERFMAYDDYRNMTSFLMTVIDDTNWVNGDKLKKINSQKGPLVTIPKSFLQKEYSVVYKLYDGRLYGVGKKVENMSSDEDISINYIGLGEILIYKSVLDYLREKGNG